jgi:hypothetical protein
MLEGPVADFIFMLTRDDQTVPNALEVYEAVRDTDLRCVGFKDIGASADVLAELTTRMHGDGREVYLEVVSESMEDEVRSLRVAREIGVDVVMGGTHSAAAQEILGGSGLRYYPFPGRVVGHPSQLRGTVKEIAASARALTAEDHVDGLDLLAYRFDGDVPELIRAVLAAVDKPVVAAGSIDSVERIRLVSELGVAGFTIGAAIFDARLSGGSSLREQVASAISVARDAMPA